MEDVESEIARKNQAVEETDIQLRRHYEKAVPEIGEENAAIFEVHRMMLRDSYYQETIENIIRSQGVNAEYAVGNTADHFAGMLEIMDDDYMKARVADVRDVSERLIAVLMGNNSEKLFKTLSGENEDLSGGDEAEIIVAEDLSPSETVQMDKSRVRAFVTRLGSANSHTAILARTMNIPVLIGIDYEEDIDGKTAVVDGFQGTLIVDPDSETLLKYVKKEEEERSKQELLLTLKGKETVTKSGNGIPCNPDLPEAS